MLLKNEKKHSELLTTINEKNTFENLLREKDALIDNLSTQLSQLKEELREFDRGKQDLIARMQQEERDSTIRDRKDKAKLQRESEVL